MAPITIFIISDSSGETALTVAQTAVSQFPAVHATYQRFPFIQTDSILGGILSLAKKQHAMLFHTLVNRKLSDHVSQFAEDNQLQHFDCIQPAMKIVASATDLQPEGVPGLVHNLTSTYFDRIAAMEFAVAYDDGKDPTGLLKADIVILGVSRTSKTPLSLFLANRNLRVANLPLSPKTQLPEELWQVDPKRIFGLTNQPDILRRIRRERMISYGLPADGAYSDTQKISEELAYAKKLYQKIGCLVIDVSNKSIEETATLIMESLDYDQRPHPLGD
ncbi:pyruvate, water dikinase regulatory protein [Levilactobacillus suantsaii]|uniref:Putative pyruvate, phosphate dikinase regulatory protein n=1 Tax=Levilactobacillus suantsaii TaxID=2292255 RepID=A0A4Q0VKB3_9LACO|nr:pyruvate, water dikinase regulatory protein [Levilactobacillus suantsaii]QMU07567.1 kinase/pyrophosphorylase [Levilactobacillus suantsaii]RXI79609.1 kinase/pyrophosphorylase [Levilactobacillus suantsaii]